MPFSLSGLFQNHYISETAAGEALQASGEGLKVTDQRLLALTPGKTISGEVLGNNGSEIQIRLSTDLVVTARMEQLIAAGIGQNVLFEIKSNSGGTLALRPLFENMAPDGNSGKALSMAGLPINDRSVGMTNSMMEEGMNVGRDALQKMYRQVAAFPEGDVRSIVQMNRLGIPVTAENLEQFEFAPGAHTPAEYGRFMIQESGHFEYDENLEGFYDYEKFGLQRMEQESGMFTDRGYVSYHGTMSLEELMMEDPAETFREEQGLQMGGMK